MSQARAAIRARRKAKMDPRYRPPNAQKVSRRLQQLVERQKQMAARKGNKKR